ncbi:hypothetical protein AAZX31_15G188600 [Glycine max]
MHWMSNIVIGGLKNEWSMQITLLRKSKVNAIVWTCSTLAIKDNLVANGFQGELTCKEIIKMVSLKDLHSNYLIEVKGMPLIFEINQSRVK